MKERYSIEDKGASDSEQTVLGSSVQDKVDVERKLPYFHERIIWIKESGYICYSDSLHFPIGWIAK